ncbi:type III secretion system inner membrane ring lipoprotein SctJ [Cupriavidus sp. AU9028]|uniref:type III secretion system inner membrane ring lipoprotein SctJ n=1 Tax=Cupriavidus sp. AU9028 TaxID=2871157 RepID=UPI001C963749|nr:type III secretion inner membrane ring lipoprotein SctJ [Cupriavidus sp. AU9028]MBY4897871.1 type III secretion inner membrane ring lipoprotein SctJ [Cupriavidus sp. AU9028]
MTSLKSTGLAALAALLLAGCKITLYSNVGEAEANQMLALLMLRDIPAEKVVEKGGVVTLRVEKGEFINAVEVLRQNGFPQNKRLGMGDLFPSNQLVTSPAQERAKMQLLKEQQLEAMIAAMDGVIEARVSIAQKVDDNGKPTGAPSAAVFIKYSPQFNLGNQEVQIRSLVRDGIPDITSDQISVVMQAADYRYRAAAQEVPAAGWTRWIQERPAEAAGLSAAAVVGLAMLAWLGTATMRRRRTGHA